MDLSIRPEDLKTLRERVLDGDRICHEIVYHSPGLGYVKYSVLIVLLGFCLVFLPLFFYPVVVALGMSESRSGHLAV